MHNLLLLAVLLLSAPLALPFHLAPVAVLHHRLLADPSDDDPPPPPPPPAPKSSEKYVFTNANGIPVQRAAQPSAAAINALPRRLALTTLFITIPVSLTSNLFGITSSLIVSSPIPQIRDAARKIRLNDVYADKDGYKTYHQPRSPRGPAYEFVVPPLFLSDPAVLLANNSPRTYKMNPLDNVLPDVAFGPAGRVDPVTRRSSSDVTISVISYSIERKDGSRFRAISILADDNNNRLVTYTATSKEGEFTDALRRSADSFVVK
ncbi:hypothetical protein TeGR_g15096 [Tetraparma gracilis]|uniref:Uncharacterized protein n=1 Tax=Tetraparma gracilis TaxID=2962635 RepID=A0ABQ6N2Z5_9STRA|nr:hypothetical protein TeGR_g15096 [Tetraparma gracilis]